MPADVQHVEAHVFVYLYLYLCICICICVFVFVFAHMQRNRVQIQVGSQLCQRRQRNTLNQIFLISYNVSGTRE